MYGTFRNIETLDTLRNIASMLMNAAGRKGRIQDYLYMPYNAITKIRVNKNQSFSKRRNIEQITGVISVLHNFILAS